MKRMTLRNVALCLPNSRSRTLNRETEKDESGLAGGGASSSCRAARRTSESRPPARRPMFYGLEVSNAGLVSILLFLLF